MADIALQNKWRRYERRWKFRDFYFNKCLRRHGIVKYFHREPVMPHYAHKWVMSSKKTNDYIYNRILEGKPFLACRFGNTELQVLVGELKDRICGYSDENEEHTSRWYNRMCEGAGFFPNDRTNLGQYADTMLDACKQIDLLAMWHLHMEDFVIEEYAPQADLTFLFRLEPWLYHGRPWSAALKGKKVLIIHPFVETIKKQYQRREGIFPGTDILPEFDLKTLKAVQTIAGERDDRFSTWFEALEYMYNEAMKIDFDIAIIGCGAYGMPLGGMLKKAGKQAIHLGGATQLMFGIKGRRWEENYPSKIATWFNDSWVYPDQSETPKNASVVERGCYWK